MSSIAVNSAVLSRGTSGSARYTNYLMRSLSRVVGEEVVPCPGPYDAERGRVARVAAWLWWDWVGFGLALGPHGLGVSPVNFTPMVSRAPVWTVVHDTMVLDHPAAFDRSFVAAARIGYRITAARASLIITPSSYSKSRIEAVIAPRADVVVLPTGVDQHWIQSTPKTAPSRMSVLMVGATEPHKRVHLGIEAVALLRGRSDLDVHLDIVGPIGRDERRVRDLIGVVDPGASWITRHPIVPESTLQSFYRRSTLLLHVATEEGFGIPLIEAAASGLPVVHTGGGSLSEVLAPVVQPVRAASYHLADAMLDVARSPEYRDRSAALIELVGDRYSTSAIDRALGQILAARRPEALRHRIP